MRTRERLVTPLFLLVMASTFGYFISVGALIPTLPRYVEGPLGGGNVAVGLAIGGFSLTAVMIRPFAGRIGDRRGRRLLIVGGATVVAAAGAALIPISSVVALVLTRFGGGAGEAMFFVGAASVINDLAPDARRGEAVSYFSLALYGGLAVGPLAGETVLGAAGFDWAWTLAAACAGLAAVLGLFVGETRPDPGAEPPSGPILHRAGLGPGFILLTSVWGLAGFNAFVPLYVFDIGMSGSALVFALYSGIVLSIRFFGARIPDRFGPKRTAGSALAASTVGFVLMAAWGEPVGLFVGTAIFAVGQALAFPALMTMAVAAAPASERGSVVGTFTAFFDLAFGVGAVSSGAVASALSFRGAFAASALVALIGVLLVLLRGRAPRGGSAVA